jgi:FkbM family methyltransferase
LLFFNSKGFSYLLTKIGEIVCYDIGARDTPGEEVSQLGKFAKIIGFEPDQAECDRLNNIFSDNHSSVFSSIDIFPVAVGPENNNKLLHLTKHRGTSSLLTPIESIGKEFSRPDFVKVEETVSVNTKSLDNYIKAQDLPFPDYIKIDIEGYELEALKTAKKTLLDSVLAIRCEVSFITIRKSQPTYSDIDLFLNDQGFSPYGFIELHHWRKILEPYKKRGRIIKFSKGQIAHGDMLFFKSDNFIIKQGVESCIKAACIMILYGYIDNATRLLEKSGAIEWAKLNHNVDLLNEISKISRYQHRLMLINRITSVVERFKVYFSQFLNKNN